MTKTLSKTTMRGPNFTVPVLDLLAALETLKLALPTRPPVPVLGGLLVTHGVHGIELAAFDYETSVRVLLDPTPQPDYGRMLIPFAELVRIVKGGLKGESKKDQQSMTVRIDSEITKGEQEREKLSTVPGEGRITVVEPFESADVTVEVGGFTMPVESLPIEDYPTLPVFDAKPSFTVDAATLLDAWNRVAVAMRSDDTVPMLTYQRWELGVGQLTMAATDRFQLMVANQPVVQAPSVAGTNRDVQVLVPKMVGKALKLLSGPVTFGFTADDKRYPLVWLRSGNTTIATRQGENEFPRFRHLFPTFQQDTTIVVVDREPLAKLLAKTVALNGRVKQTILVFQQDRIQVVPWSESQDRVKGASLPAVTAGKALRMAVDPEYLLELVGAFTGDTVALATNSPTKPLLVAPESAHLFDEEAPLRGLMMPQRLPG